MLVQHFISVSYIILYSLLCYSNILWSYYFFWYSISYQENYVRAFHYHCEFVNFVFISVIFLFYILKLFYELLTHLELLPLPDNLTHLPLLNISLYLCFLPESHTRRVSSTFGLDSVDWMLCLKTWIWCCVCCNVFNDVQPIWVSSWAWCIYRIIVLSHKVLAFFFFFLMQQQITEMGLFHHV